MMSRYPLNLPIDLKREAEEWAATQGVSLNQFIMWAVAEKVGALRQQLDDPKFPQITYRRGGSGIPTPVVRGTGIRVQTLVVAHHQEGLSVEKIAEEYPLTQGGVKEALSFYEVHQAEIDHALEAEQRLEAERTLESEHA
jgi:uncharacterized protein (DUF433 family)